MENMAARQAESFGRSMRGVGVQMSRMAMHMQEEASQLRLDELNSGPRSTDEADV